MVRQQIFGYLQALTAVFFWSLNVIIATVFMTKLSPIEFAFGRWFFAFLILLPMTFFSLKQNYRYLLKHWIWILGLAVTGVVLDNTLIYMAAQSTSAVNMGLLNSLGPIFLCVLTWIFLKDRVYLWQVFGILIALLGVFIIITSGHFHQLETVHFSIGDIWIILNAFCFAIYSFLQYRRPDFIPQSTLLAATVCVGLLILFPTLLSMTPVARLKEIGTDSYAVLIFLGIFNSVISYLAWNSALVKIGPIKTGMIYYILPVLTLVEAVVFLKEKLSIIQVVGGIFVLAGIVIVGKAKKVSSAG